MHKKVRREVRGKERRGTGNGERGGATWGCRAAEEKRGPRRRERAKEARQTCSLKINFSFRAAPRSGFLTARPHAIWWNRAALTWKTLKDRCLGQEFLIMFPHRDSVHQEIVTLNLSSRGTLKHSIGYSKCYSCIYLFILGGWVKLWAKSHVIISFSHYLINNYNNYNSNYFIHFF